MNVAASKPVTPGDVEALISAHRDVLQCVVVPTAGKPGGPGLVAHYVLRPSATLDAAGLRDYLAQRLPPLAPPIGLRRHVAFPPTRNGTVELEHMSG